MKKININKLIAEANEKKVSVHLLIKRELGYKKKTDPVKTCYWCKSCDKIIFHGESKERTCCHIVGFKNDSYAYVDDNHICKCFDKRYNKIKE